MEATLNHIIKETDYIWTFQFSTARPLDFIAGQFVELDVPHVNPDDRGTKRWFTVSSAPEDPYLAITTHFSREHSSTFKDSMKKLSIGHTVTLSEPMGDFVLPRDADRPLIFVAAGIGITPFHSIFKHLIASGKTRNIQFIYAVSTEEDIVFQETFEEAGVHTTIIVKHASAEWGGERGRINAKTIVGLSQPDKDSLLYVSGPESLVEDLTKQLKKAGLSSDQLLTDYFSGYSGV